MHKLCGRAILHHLQRGSGVHTVTFNTNLEELYITKSTEGADVLPTLAYVYEEICPTTVTQHYSNMENGMCYFIRLADGSFIVIDGGYASDAADAYATLCHLNGSAEGIHIRAWLMTHSHDDHYSIFKAFAQDYADSVRLDTFLYSPVIDIPQRAIYLNNSSIQKDVAAFEGAKLCAVRTGMSFDFVDVTFEILLTPEQVYKNGDVGNFNETSVVSIVENSEGSVIFLGDCGENACNWMVSSYGDALKSDMVQVSHHGCETATAELYDKISASTVFWPCSEGLMCSERGELVKQHILEAEYSKEHILHGYGTTTRELSYKSVGGYLDVLPKHASLIKGSDDANDIRIEEGVLKYTVEGTDPYVYFNVSGVDSSKYNAIKMVVGADDLKDAQLFFKMSNNTSFSQENSKYFGKQGVSDDGQMTVIIYLGNKSGYSGALSALRLDLNGNGLGDVVEIYSLEMCFVDVDG